jgi:hypothetical protein
MRQSQQISHKPTKILTTGNSGTGKSTFYTRYILNAIYDRKFIFDHEGEFQQRLDCGACYKLSELPAWTQEFPVVVYDPSEEFSADLPLAFESFCKFVFEASKQLPGKKLMCCDELQKLIGVNTVSRPLAAILETGRRRGLDTIMVTQQANAVHNRVREQLTEIVTFKQLTDNAIEFLAQMGFSAEELRGLEPLHYVDRNLLTGKEYRGEISFK